MLFVLDKKKKSILGSSMGLTSRGNMPLNAFKVNLVLVRGARLIALTTNVYLATEE